VPALEGEQAPFSAPSRFLAAEWLVPDAARVGAARETVSGLAQSYGADSAWFYQGATQVDAREGGDEEEDDEEDEDDEDEEEDESRWVNGPPPRAESAPFALERYPDIIEQFDWEDFGIALKLGGARDEGEQMVLDAFHSFWIAPYKGKHRHA